MVPRTCVSTRPGPPSPLPREVAATSGPTPCPARSSGGVTLQSRNRSSSHVFFLLKARVIAALPHSCSCPPPRDPGSTGPWQPARAPLAPAQGTRRPEARAGLFQGGFLWTAGPWTPLSTAVRTHGRVGRTSSGTAGRPLQSRRDQSQIPVQMPRPWGCPPGGPAGDGPCSGAWGQAPLGRPTHAVTARGPGGWVRGPGLTLLCDSPPHRASSPSATKQRHP